MDASGRLEDFPFSYRAGRGGVFISYQGRVVTTLRGEEVRRFLAQVGSLDPLGLQHRLARLTGNFRRAGGRR